MEALDPASENTCERWRHKFGSIEFRLGYFIHLGTGPIWSSDWAWAVGMFFYRLGTSTHDISEPE